MNIFLCGTLLFGIAFFLHIIVWKIQIPKKQMKALILIFFSVFISGMLSISFVQCNKSLFCQEAIIYFSEIIRVTIFFTALTFSYFLVYASFIGESPSLFLVWNIANSGKIGLNKNDLYKLIEDDIFIKPRFEYLIEENMVNKIGGKYLLSPKGNTFISIIIIVRKIMKLSKNNG